ncbi:galactoside O-acetyltransferase [[Clostridium] sordellii]|uniref:acyltransferase n=1 Tax=Paraclostridium sordellii TaxID=1505 RepID=UPI0005E62E3C|nr:acyltransferase [Paeniclostridium sordellii]CEP91035.1 galactoside O-acetyltransferase [[Clostridium] sordellii] [Paeniclostridium sordellii]
MISKVKSKIVILTINTFLKGTRFFKIKNKLLNWCGYSIGYNTKVVGPINMPININLCIGDNCWIGRSFTIDGNGTVEIMNNVDIGPEVLISTGSHKIGNRDRRAGIGKTLRTTIEEGCWIGTRSLIIEGANISSGSVVGAGTIVNRTMEKDSLILGASSKVIRKLI